MVFCNYRERHKILAADHWATIRVVHVLADSFDLLARGKADFVVYIGIVLFSMLEGSVIAHLKCLYISKIIRIIR